IRNKITDREGGYAMYFPTKETLTVYDTAMRYQADGTPLVVLAGKDYGSGSSRDWAAKGSRLLGIRAVIAESFERIHRSNLVGMGILPVQFPAGESAQSLGFTGEEEMTVRGMSSHWPPFSLVKLRAEKASGELLEFEARARSDSDVQVK